MRSFVWRVTAKFTRSVHPVVSPSAEQTLHLDETSIYELFGSSSGMYQFVSRNNNPITSLVEARKNPVGIIAAIFDLGKAKDICESCGLTFQHRISTNGKVAILQGSLIHRRTYEMTSRYDRRHERKKASAKPAVQDDDTKNQIGSLTDVIDGLQKRQKEIVKLRQSLQNEVKLAKGRFYEDRSDLNFRNWQDKKAAMQTENRALLTC
ncbi:uncharacterized protein BYT42DRAFT_264403 [Radiomyces spectabilis]|uniref:uncharacterized protein n=1 Tax=Radiomyces spectabilis TaxID=64574 RepID=UPI00221E65B6|nr:uncharacterized protein BYT42DRAFT_264403 [Radiomyces spectabilis]KAI8384533.1 hypothetical protein BYT42DRAFT_264403 [Radiomyces spectabilis]